MKRPILIEAHKLCTNNRKTLFNSKSCACFYCFRAFPPHEITEWTDDDSTAICPHCGIDSIITLSDALPEVSLDKDFLQRMHDYWFRVST